MAKSLTSTELHQIHTALTEARGGRASLTQLAQAHDLAQGANLNGTLGELRDHIRANTPCPPLRSEGKALVIGIISGIFTHILLSEMGKRK